MPAAPLPPNEPERLDALRQTRLLDTQPEPFFDDMIDQVRQRLGSPIVLISLVDESRQWFKACYGLALSETDRDSAFCAHAILNETPLVIADALADTRFVSNPFVVGAPYIRAYAGAPIALHSGMPLGAVCALDVRARAWDPAEIEFLVRSARLTARYIEARIATELLAEARLSAESAAADALRSRDALLESERQFRDLAEAAGDMIVRFQPDTTMTYVSPASSTVLGYAPEELFGRRMRDFVHPEDVAKGLEYLAAIESGGPGGPPVRIRVRARCKDGSWRWVEGSPRVVTDPRTGMAQKFYDVIRDVTEQKELEGALTTARERAETSETHYRLLADHATDIIVRRNLEGVVRYVSPAIRRLGYSPEEWIGRSILDLAATEDKAFTASLMEALAAGVEPDLSIRREFRALRADGAHVWLEGFPSIVRDGQGKPLEIIITFRDVSTRRAMEDQLIAARANAEAAAEAKSAFLANMSHELRTPLNSVIGFSRLLAASTQLTAKDQRFASLIEASSRTTLSIVNDVLDFAAIEQGTIHLREAAFSARNIVADVRDMLAPEADAKGLAFNLRIDSTLAELHFGDADRLRQILLNLATNAVKFTAQGSVSLTVAAAGDAAGEQMLRFEVKDTGIGVPSEQREAIFERFVQIPDNKLRYPGGSGLGLAISKRLVEHMGGALDLRSEVGKGSTFAVTLTLPVAAAAADAGVSVNAPKRILVVDDVDLNRELAQTILELAGHRVETAHDGAGALALSQDSNFDLILMDAQMPGMDGLAATRAIRAGGGASAQTPIVALTAGALPEQVASYLLAGMNGHLLKPLLEDDLVRAVAAWTKAHTPTPAQDEARVVDDLKQRFAARLSEERAALIEAYSRNPQQPDIRTLVHRLAGSAGSFGFVRIGELAGAMNEALALGQNIATADLVALLGAMDDAVGGAETPPAAQCAGYADA